MKFLDEIGGEHPLIVFYYLEAVAVRRAAFDCIRIKQIENVCRCKICDLKIDKAFTGVLLMSAIEGSGSYVFLRFSSAPPIDRLSLHVQKAALASWKKS